jgi:hypothetical protein
MALTQGNLNQESLLQLLPLDLRIAMHRMLAAHLVEQHIRQMLELVVEKLPQLGVGLPTQSSHLRRSHKLAPHTLSSFSSLLHVLVQLEEVEMWSPRSLVAQGFVGHIDLEGGSPARIHPVAPPLFNEFEDLCKLSVLGLRNAHRAMLWWFGDVELFCGRTRVKCGLAPRSYGKVV